MGLLADAVIFSNVGLRHQKSMKIRRSILWFSAAAMVLIALVIWFTKLPIKSAMEPNTSQYSENVTAAIPQPKATAPAAIINHGAVLTLPQTNAVSAQRTTKADLIRGVLSTENDVPIIFYGKLEDQFGNPVTGAQIAGNTIIYSGTRTGGEHVVTTSDSNGLFKIDAGKGESLGIMPEKEGYVLAMTATAFKYSHLYEGYHVPDPNNPVVIKMRKLQGVELLVGIGKEYKLPYTGAPLFFDLLTGKVSESGGDLQVVVTRAPGSLSKRNPGDWSIEFKPVNGGIIESDDSTSRMTYEAPEEGYQSNCLVQMNHENPAWFDNVQKVFFITSRNGQVYSKLAVDFGINREPNGTMWFQFKGAANAAGSRNWEATAPR